MAQGEALGVTGCVKTGIAGPGGGSIEKPVGTVCFAWASATQVTSRRRVFKGDRSDIQAKAISYASFILGHLEALDGSYQ